MQSTREILEQQNAAQAAMAPKPEDARVWLTRYLFVPFRDKKLSSYYQSEYNLTKLQAGIIERIKRFDRTELNHKSIMDVPHDRFGRPMSVGYGNHGMRSIERRPVDVIEGILRAHNPSSVSAGMEDNGICEVKPLTGVDDNGVRFQLQEQFLPSLYPTAREQRVQLEAAIKAADGMIFTDGFGKRRPFNDVGNVLLNSTLTAIRFGIMKYRALQNAVEEWGRTGRTGKAELSKFDIHLCSWLEVPQPKLESMLQSGNLQQHAQTQVPVIKPTVQCFACGTEANLLPDGAYPKLGCIACGSKTFGREEEKEELAEELIGEAPSRLEKRQAEMRAKRQ